MNPKEAPRKIPSPLKPGLPGVLIFSAAATSSGQGLGLDGSGVSELWLVQYGMETHELDQDFSGDGASNRLAGIAGTDPRDPKARFRLAGLEFTQGSTHATLRWHAVAGKQYTAEFSPDLITWYPAGPSWIGDGAEMTVTLPLGATFTSPGATLARWNDLPTETFSNLRDFARNESRMPDETDALSTLETPQTNPNASDYSQFIRGWIIPPTTGIYTFWIASDHTSEAPTRATFPSSHPTTLALMPRASSSTLGPCRFSSTLFQETLSKSALVVPTANFLPKMILYIHNSNTAAARPRSVLL
ncbi:MAG: hypothetical protein ACFCU4_06250 [Puniceicoccaceae bacterium]